MLTLLLVDVLSAETSVCLLACHICFALFARTCFLLLLAFYSRVLAPAETSVCLMSYLFCFIRAYLLSQRFAFGFFLLVFVFIFVGVLAPACFLFLSAETSACLLACHIYFACLRTRSCWIIWRSSWRRTSCCRKKRSTQSEGGSVTPPAKASDAASFKGEGGEELSEGEGGEELSEGEGGEELSKNTQEKAQGPSFWWWWDLLSPPAQEERPPRRPRTCRGWCRRI